MLTPKRIITIGLASLSMLLSGCAVHFDNVVVTSSGRAQLAEMDPKMDRNIRELAGALLSLGPYISRDEAMDLAYDSYVYPMKLANEWGLTWPPMYHNTLRNAKLRPKGLCVDWADAMITMARRKNMKTMDIYWGVSNRGDPWREHSTLIVTAKGQPFDTGIILDPWRNSGKLYWLHHIEDPAYKWKYHAGPFSPLPPLGQSTAKRIVQ